MVLTAIISILLRFIVFQSHASISAVFDNANIILIAVKYSIGVSIFRINGATVPRKTNKANAYMI